MDATQGCELMDREYASWTRAREEEGSTAVLDRFETHRNPRDTSIQLQGQQTRPDSCREDFSRELAHMHAVVVVGEHSWGGGGLEDLACRPLMDVAGKPLVVHIMQWLAAQGIRRTSICANSHTRPVRECIGDGRKFGLAVQYYTDVMPRGPAGCVRDAAGDSAAETVLAICGTLIPRMSLGALIRQHSRNGSWATVAACASENGGLEPVGLYMFSSRVLEHIPATGYQDIKETLLPQIRRQAGRIELFRASDRDLLRVTDVESYALANRQVIEDSLESLCGPDYVRNGEAWIHRTCEIHPSVRFIGPVIVGPNCTIAADAVMVGACSIGANCKIGPGAVISRSTIAEACRIGRGAIVDNSLLFCQSVLEPMLEVRNSFWAGRPGLFSSGATANSDLPKGRRLAS